MAQIGSDVYACWRATLKGEVFPASSMLPTGLGGVDGHPQPGLYKKREGGGYQDGQRQPVRFVPVKIILARDPNDPSTVVHKWEPGLSLIAVQGKDRIVDAQKVWLWLRTSDATGKNVTYTAISTETYKYWLSHERWPDDAPETPEPCEEPQPEPPAGEQLASLSANTEGEAPAGIGHNSSQDPDGHAALVSMLAIEQASVDAWIAQGKEGKQAADFAQNWRDKLIGVERRVLAAFAAEKEPYLRKCQEIDEKWRAAKASASLIKQKMAAAFNAIASRETARLQAIANEEARKRTEALRREQEAQHQRQMEEARKAREASAADAMPLIDEPAPPPPPPPVVVPEQVHMTFGTSGRKAAPKAAPKVAVITDWRAAAAHYAMADTVKAAVQRLADADAKKGIACPGAEIGSKDVAA